MASGIKPNKLSFMHFWDYERLRRIILLYTFRVQRCWICCKFFANRTELNRHLSGKAHTRLAVICPWCLGKEKTFTRVNDLQQHVSVTHRNIYSSLPPSFFTTGTGFFFARHPNDYRKIVQVSPYENDECFEAGKAVLRWSASQLNATVVSQTWRNGWLQEKEHLRPSVPGKRTAAASSCEASLPDFGVDPGVQVDAEVSVKKPRPVRPLEYPSDSSEDTVTITDDTESPKDFSAEAIDVDVLPSGDSRDVQISDTTEAQPSSSSITQEPLGPSGEGHPSVVTEDVKEEDPLPGELKANSQVTTNQEVTPNQDVPAATPGPSCVSNDRPTGLQERACHLLKYGQLPHFAPARRDWDKAGIVSFGLGAKTTLGLLMAGRSWTRTGDSCQLSLPLWLWNSRV